MFADESDCGILLDVNNLYVSAVNHDDTCDPNCASSLPSS